MNSDLELSMQACAFNKFCLVVSVCTTGLDTKKRVLLYTLSSTMQGHTPTLERDLQQEVEADVHEQPATLHVCAYTP